MSKKTLDPQRAKEAKEYIEEITGDRLSDDFQESLKTGVVLCNFLNKLHPGTIAKINKSNMPFMQMENIASYIAGTKAVGVPDEYNFMTVDLFEGKDLNQVAQNVLTLKRLAGHGFKKDKSNAPMVHLNTTSDQSTESKAQSDFVTRDPKVFTNDSDVSRVGTAYQSGRVTNDVAFTCGVCTKYITSGIVNALGRTWHPNCFTCKKCGVKLSTSKYYEHLNSAYCDRCILVVNPQQNVRAATSDKANLFAAKKQ